MKKVFMIALSAMMLAGTAVMAQGTTTKTDAQPAPGLKWKTQNINMGKIPQGVPATATFEFTNVGKTPVVLKTVQPGCGCTTAGYTKEPVAPGKNGEVKATYNAMNMGSFSKSVTVTTDSNETIVLIISGEVIAKPAAPTGK